MLKYSRMDSCVKSNVKFVVKHKIRTRKSYKFSAFILFSGGIYIYEVEFHVFFSRNFTRSFNINSLTVFMELHSLEIINKIRHNICPVQNTLIKIKPNHEYR